MILFICSVRDSAAGTYGRPFFMPATGVAVRTFSDEVNRPSSDNVMYQHPEDFELYHLGLFDDIACRFELNREPVLLARGKDVILPEDKLKVVK